MFNLGLSLQEKRENAELSQSELALRTGIKQQNISRWESNTNVPNVLDCVKLADFYSISLDYLVGREKVETGIVETHGAKLNDKEQKLIDCYRSLTEDGKSAFISMAENVANMYRRASKIS